MNYRHEASLRLAAAKVELASGDDKRLRYAALDLRMAMEGLTYDRALAYKDEFPPDEYQTWQPRRIMSVLLEIDASADQGSSLAFGAESEDGASAPVMQSLGTEQVLNMGILRKHYDALGSYLHLPSIKQMKAGEVVHGPRLRKRCEELAAAIDAVLSSQVFNVTLGTFVSFECARCQHRIRKRLPHDSDEIAAECFECHATYRLKRLADGQIEIRPRQEEVYCVAEGCAGKAVLWEGDFQAGRFWHCDVCGGRNILALGLRYERDTV